MKKILVCSVLLFMVSGLFAQRKPNYNINYSAEQIKGRIEQPKVVFFQGILAGRAVDFSVAVVVNNKGINLTFANSSVNVSEANNLGAFRIKSNYGETVLANGIIEKRGPGNYYMNIAKLPRGNYILSIDNINSGQSISFSNY